MHCVVLSPGLRLERLNRAVPESSSDNATVPAAKALPGLVVVAVKAALVAFRISAPQAATETRPISPFCRRRSHPTRRERGRARRDRTATPPSALRADSSGLLVGTKPAVINRATRMTATWVR